MILHYRGEDTRRAFVWEDDDGEELPIDETEFVVTDADDQVVADVGEITADTYPIELHIAQDADIDVGVYTYRLRARSDPDWRIVSAGLLRVK